MRPTRHLCIKNLPSRTNEDDLNAIIQSFGRISSIQIQNRTAVVSCYDQKMALKILETGLTLHKTPLDIQFSDSFGNIIDQYESSGRSSKRNIKSRSSSIDSCSLDENMRSKDDSFETNSGRGLAVSNLPKRSSSNNLREGLFHEFKKFGKITSVIIDGQGSERVALITFKKTEDAEKAYESSQNKIFFRTQIKVEKALGADTEDPDLCPPEHIMDEYHPKATKTLFVGNLCANTITKEDLHQVFFKYGEIIEIDIKNQANQLGTSYAFVQYNDIKSVVTALNDQENVRIDSKTVKLGFGKSQPTNVVWLDNLTSGITENFLKRHFNRFGRLSYVIIDEKLMRALLYFDNPEIAQRALNETKNRPILNRKVQIDFASQECQIAFIRKTVEHNSLTKTKGSSEKLQKLFRFLRFNSNYPLFEDKKGFLDCFPKDTTICSSEDDLSEMGSIVHKRSRKHRNLTPISTTSGDANDSLSSDSESRKASADDTSKMAKYRGQRRRIESPSYERSNSVLRCTMNKNLSASKDTRHDSIEKSYLKTKKPLDNNTINDASRPVTASLHVKSPLAYSSSANNSSSRRYTQSTRNPSKLPSDIRASSRDETSRMNGSLPKSYSKSSASSSLNRESRTTACRLPDESSSPGSVKRSGHRSTHHSSQNSSYDQCDSNSDVEYPIKSSRKSLTKVSVQSSRMKGGHLSRRDLFDAHSPNSPPPPPPPPLPSSPPPQRGTTLLATAKKIKEINDADPEFCELSKLNEEKAALLKELSLLAGKGEEKAPVKLATPEESVGERNVPPPPPPHPMSTNIILNNKKSLQLSPRPENSFPLDEEQISSPIKPSESVQTPVEGGQDPLECKSTPQQQQQQQPKVMPINSILNRSNPVTAPICTTTSGNCRLPSQPSPISAPKTPIMNKEDKLTSILTGANYHPLAQAFLQHSSTKKNPDNEAQSTSPVSPRKEDVAEVVLTSPTQSVKAAPLEETIISAPVVMDQKPSQPTTDSLVSTSNRLIGNSSISDSVDERIRLLDQELMKTEKVRPVVDYSKFRIRRKNDSSSNSALMSNSSAASSTTSTNQSKFSSVINPTQSALSRNSIYSCSVLPNEPLTSPRSLKVPSYPSIKSPNSATSLHTDSNDFIKSMLSSTKATSQQIPLAYSNPVSSTSMTSSWSFPDPAGHANKSSIDTKASTNEIMKKIDEEFKPERPAKLPPTLSHSMSMLEKKEAEIKSDPEVKSAPPIPPKSDFNRKPIPSIFETKLNLQNNSTLNKRIKSESKAHEQEATPSRQISEVKEKIKKKEEKESIKVKPTTTNRLPWQLKPDIVTTSSKVASSTPAPSHSAQSSEKKAEKMKQKPIIPQHPPPVKKEVGKDNELVSKSANKVYRDINQMGKKNKKCDSLQNQIPKKKRKILSPSQTPAAHSQQQPSSHNNSGLIKFKRKMSKNVSSSSYESSSHDEDGFNLDNLDASANLYESMYDKIKRRTHKDPAAIVSSAFDKKSSKKSNKKAKTNNTLSLSFSSDEDSENDLETKEKSPGCKISSFDRQKLLKELSVSSTSSSEEGGYIPKELNKSHQGYADQKKHKGANKHEHSSKSQHATLEEIKRRKRFKKKRAHLEEEALLTKNGLQDHPPMSKHSAMNASLPEQEMHHKKRRPDDSVVSHVKKLFSDHESVGNDAKKRDMKEMKKHSSSAFRKQNRPVKEELKKSKQISKNVMASPEKLPFMMESALYKSSSESSSPKISRSPSPSDNDSVFSDSRKPTVVQPSEKSETKSCDSDIEEASKKIMDESVAADDTMATARSSDNHEESRETSTANLANESADMSSEKLEVDRMEDSKIIPLTNSTPQESQDSINLTKSDQSAMERSSLLINDSNKLDTSNTANNQKLEKSVFIPQYRTPPTIVEMATDSKMINLPGDIHPQAQLPQQPLVQSFLPVVSSANGQTALLITTSNDGSSNIATTEIPQQIALLMTAASVAQQQQKNQQQVYQQNNKISQPQQSTPIRSTMNPLNTLANAAAFVHPPSVAQPVPPVVQPASHKTKTESAPSANVLPNASAVAPTNSGGRKAKTDTPASDLSTYVRNVIARVTQEKEGQFNPTSGSANTSSQLPLHHSGSSGGETSTTSLNNSSYSNSHKKTRTKKSHDNIKSPQGGQQQQQQHSAKQAVPTGQKTPSHGNGQKVVSIASKPLDPYEPNFDEEQKTPRILNSATRSRHSSTSADSINSGYNSHQSSLLFQQSAQNISSLVLEDLRQQQQQQQQQQIVMMVPTNAQNQGTPLVVSAAASTSSSSANNNPVSVQPTNLSPATPITNSCLNNNNNVQSKILLSSPTPVPPNAPASALFNNNVKAAPQNLYATPAQANVPSQPPRLASQPPPQQQQNIPKSLVNNNNNNLKPNIEQMAAQFVGNPLAYIYSLFTQQQQQQQQQTMSTSSPIPGPTATTATSPTQQQLQQVQQQQLATAGLVQQSQGVTTGTVNGSHQCPSMTTTNTIMNPMAQTGLLQPNQSTSNQIALEFITTALAAAAAQQKQNQPTIPTSTVSTQQQQPLISILSPQRPLSVPSSASGPNQPVPITPLSAATFPPDFQPTAIQQQSHPSPVQLLTSIYEASISPHQMAPANANSSSVSTPSSAVSNASNNHSQQQQQQQQQPLLPSNESIVTNFTSVWRGRFILKNEEFTSQMFHLSGNADLFNSSLRVLSNDAFCRNSLDQHGRSGLLKIVQRMRFDPTQLEGVNRKLRQQNDYVICLALSEPLAEQQNILKNSFIRYLHEKSAAGIINVMHPVTNENLYVIHVFPPCEFSSKQFLDIPSGQLLHNALNDKAIPYLMVIITTV